MDDIQLIVETLSATVDAALNHTQTHFATEPSPSPFFRPFGSNRHLPPPRSHHDPPPPHHGGRPTAPPPLHSLQQHHHQPPPFRNSSNFDPPNHFAPPTDDMYPLSSLSHQIPSFPRGNYPPDPVSAAEYDNSLKDFLEKLDLDEYCDAFLREEVTDVASLRHLESSDLKQIGLSLGKICKIRSALSQNPSNPEEQEVPVPERPPVPKRKRNPAEVAVAEKDAKWAKTRRVKSPSQVSSPQFSPESSLCQKSSRKPYAEVHEMRPIVRVRLKELWPSFDKEWKRLNGKTEDGQTIRHISEHDFKNIVDSLCSQFSNPRWAWESEIKIVEKNHIDELVKQSKRKKTAEKKKKMRQDCAPGDWKRENIPESVMRLEPQTVSSWPRLRESLKGRKTTQVDLASAMRTSLNERRNRECPTTLDKMRECMNDCPAYRRMQGFFIDICLIFERTDITWNILSHRLELVLVAVYHIMAEREKENLQRAVNFAAAKLKCRLTENELFSSISEKSWRERYPDVLIPAWLWLLRRSEGTDPKSSIEEDFHKEGIASQVFQQMWPRLNKKNTGVFDLMLCSICVWYLLPLFPGAKSQMGVMMLEIILNQSINVHLDSSLKEIQRMISQKVAELDTENSTSSNSSSSQSTSTKSIAKGVESLVSQHPHPPLSQGKHLVLGGTTSSLTSPPIQQLQQPSILSTSTTTQQTTEPTKASDVSNTQQHLPIQINSSSQQSGGGTQDSGEGAQQQSPTEETQQQSGVVGKAQQLQQHATSTSHQHNVMNHLTTTTGVPSKYSPQQGVSQLLNNSSSSSTNSFSRLSTGHQPLHQTTLSGQTITASSESALPTAQIETSSTDPTKSTPNLSSSAPSSAPSSSSDSHPPGSSLDRLSLLSGRPSLPALPSHAPSPSSSSLNTNPLASSAEGLRSSSLSSYNFPSITPFPSQFMTHSFERTSSDDSPNFSFSNSNRSHQQSNFVSASNGESRTFGGRSGFSSSGRNYVPPVSLPSMRPSLNEDHHKCGGT